MNNAKQELLNFCRDIGGHNISDSTYYECANFLFFTSWFEEVLFNDDNKQNPNNDIKIADDLSQKIDLSVFDFFGDYFSARYIKNDITTNHLFNNLKLSTKNAVKVSKSLIDYMVSKQRDKNLLWSYIMIVYRFRNNMFHGSKGLINLNNYVDQFSIINKFMKLLLIEIINKKYVGYN